MDLDRLPPAFSGPSAWTGREMRDRTDWVVTLTEDQVDEIEAVARRFLSAGGDPGETTAEDFPLPQFSGRLAQLRETLLNGRGFEVIRGLPVAGYDQRLAATIFCGIGAHLGKARSQNAQGHVLGHVRDLGANPDDPNSRIYQTSARQTFHTDSADVVGLLCLREAREGGDSLLVSAEAIYN
ncbi:MAG: TauD/TfdA family dioxygenase, partial [Boseongicola sp. SB0670_bin_30]|nr:TauD/TfdA family dioxygenase [Boseongicola sp. SB0670_bin_30]